MRIKVKSDVKAMTRDLKKVQKKIVPKVTARAMNKTMNKIFTASANDISKHHAIKPKKLLTGVRNKGGRMRKYPAKAPHKMSAKIFIGFDKAIKVKVKGVRKILALLEGTTSKVFTSNGKKYVRHPVPSTRFGKRGGNKPNMPIKRVDEGTYKVRMGNTARLMLTRNADKLSSTFFQKEFKRLLKVALER